MKKQEMIGRSADNGARTARTGRGLVLDLDLDDRIRCEPAATPPARRSCCPLQALSAAAAAITKR